MTFPPAFENQVRGYSILGFIVAFFFFSSQSALAANPVLDQDVTINVPAMSVVGATMDANGNIFITGDSLNATGSPAQTLNRYVVAKVSGATLALDPTWGTNGIATIDVNPGVTGEQRPRGIAVDSSGNVYVTGRSNNLGFLDVYTVKLSSIGTRLWYKSYGASGTDDYGECVGAKSDGSLIYAAGTLVSTSSIVEYNSGGTQLQAFGGTDGNVLDPCTLTVASDGALHATMLTKYASSGALLFGANGNVGATALDTIHSHIYGNSGKYNAVTGLGATGIGSIQRYPSVNLETSKIYIYSVQPSTFTAYKTDFVGNIVWSASLGFVPVATGADSSRRVYFIGDGGLSTIRIKRYTIPNVLYPQDPITWITDPIITAGVTPIRAAHVTELRTNINNRRGNAGLGNYSWSSSTISVGSSVTAAHFTEMRTAIEQAYSNCGTPSSTWASGSIGPGLAVKSTHVQELRNKTDFAPVCGVRYIFITSSTYNGNLGGLSGADAKCQTAATAGGLPGTYKAWLSDGTGSAQARLASTTMRYILPVSGLQVALDFNDLADTYLDRSISTNEFGAAVSGAATAWSNSNEKGGGLGNHCTNWTSGVAGPFGGVGIAGSTTSSWTLSGTSACNNVNRLYCVQQ